MDKDAYISFKILDTLNRARKEKGEYACVNLKDIADELSIDFHFFMMRYGNELHKLDYIVPDLGHCAYITAKGIAVLEQNNPLYQNYRPVENKNITINAPVTGSAIIQGNNNTANITLNFLESLEKEITQSNLTPEEKKTWLSRIKEISSHPLLASLVAKALEILAK